MNTDPDLIPPDFERCQCERKEGSFMTLGPRSMVRCKSAPVWLAAGVLVMRDDGAKTSICIPIKQIRNIQVTSETEGPER